MKKVLAIVLAVIMTFSMTVAGFAAVEIAEGKMFLGMDDVAYANPGETIDIPVYYSGNPFDSDGYPTEGAFVLQFWVFQDVNDLVVNGFTPSDEAIAAGAELYVNPDSGFNSSVWDDGSGYYQGTFIMPATGVKSNNLLLGNLNVTVSEEWVVEDNVAEYNIAVPFDFYGYFISEEDAALIESGDIFLDDAGIVMETNMDTYLYGSRDILARPYEPTKSEYLTEYMKGIAALLVEVIGIGLNFLKGELETAPWYDPTTPPEGLEFLTQITAGLEEIMGKLIGSII